MLLETSIKPRRDGTVVATVGDARYTFRRDDDGRLSASVGNADHVAQLLRTGSFSPVFEEDFDAADTLLGSTSVAAILAGGDPPAAPVAADRDTPDSALAGDELLDGEDPPDMNALPIEANTPKSPKPPRKVK